MGFSVLSSGLSRSPATTETNRIQSAGTTVPALTLRANAAHAGTTELSRLETAGGDRLFGVFPGGNGYHQAQTGFTGSFDFLVKDDAHPRVRVDFAGGAAIQFGPGTAAADAVLRREPTQGMSLSVPASTGAPLYGLRIVRGAGETRDFDGTGGGNNIRLYLTTEAAGGTNGTRGDPITDDGANSGGHSSYSGIQVRGTGSLAFDDKGSMHQYYGALTVDPFSGGGDVYCEGFNYYCGLITNRRGALTGNAEFKHDILAGAPARACGMRLIIQEFNEIGDYTSAIFGDSYWTTSGSRGLEIIAQGTGAQPCGTGILLLGSQGFHRAIALSQGGFERFVVDGLGFVDIRRPATTNAAMRCYTDSDTEERYQIRMDGRTSWGPGGASGVDTSLERSAAGTLRVNGALTITTNVGFYNTAPVAKPAVTGSRGGNAALASLLTALASQGLVTNSSTA